MNTKYPILLSPGKIGPMELRNKTVMAAMGMNQSDHGFVNDAVVNHYVERAKGGIGLIIVEVTCVDTPLGLNTERMLVIDDDKYIPGMSRLASSIHQEGAKCILQISHTGRGARRSIIGEKPVGPSAVAMPYSFMMGLSNEEPRALTIDEIHEIEEKYAQAALRAKKAGFDGVELHSVGYYLGQQFLSSKANIRTDEYGGNPENRVRFHLNIIRRIRELCGDDFAVLVKLSAVEGGEDGGITMEDGMYYAKRFQDEGVDAIEVLAGTWAAKAGEDDVPTSGAPNCQAVGLCAALKYGIAQITGAPATIPMIGGGNVQDPAKAEEVLASQQCDFIFIGHGVLAEPHMVRLIDEGKEDEVRPCIGCGICIDSQLQEGGNCCCSGNAVVGQGNNDYTLPPIKKVKNVVVIGGGVAGVEVARIAAKRGHKVSLYEKTDKIGGQLYAAVKPPFKQNMEPLIPYLSRQLELNNVDVHLNTELDVNEIVGLNADAIVLATGVKPATLPVNGAEIALRANDVLFGAPTGDNVVIIGGGSVGCETAELLAKQGKKVTVIEMMDTMCKGMVNVSRYILLSHLKSAGVNLLTNSTCKKITDKKVIYTDSAGNEHELAVDNVISAIGDLPNDTLYNKLIGKVPELYNVGDSNGGGLIVNAVAQGYRVGIKL